MTLERKIIRRIEGAGKYVKLWWEDQEGDPRPKDRFHDSTKWYLLQEHVGEELGEVILNHGYVGLAVTWDEGKVVAVDRGRLASDAESEALYQLVLGNAGQEMATMLLEHAPRAWPGLLAEWIRRVTYRQGREVLRVTDEELAKWICGAFNCDAEDHAECSTRSQADMIASRRLVERAAAHVRGRLVPTRALSPEGEQCEVCVVCGTLLIPGPPPHCEGGCDPEELGDDELHVPREDW